ncbi:MAG: amidohydrolase family protein, partial [Bacteriovoracaceae bacterium]|nr:amidohydrolase family protein [Bacteriovoracaceae bacterium]
KDAIEFCENYTNVYCDSSSQPTEIIQEALERIPNKLMFGTDWPLVGSNQTTMVQRSNMLEIDKEVREHFTHKTAEAIFKFNTQSK